MSTSPKPLLVLFYLFAALWLAGIFAAGWTAGGTVPVAAGFVGLLGFLATAVARIAREDHAP